MSTPDDLPIRAAGSRQFGPRDWPASPEVAELEEADSHFTPPLPPRERSVADPVRRIALIGACLGPVLAIVGLILRAAYGGRAMASGTTSGISTLITGLLLFSALLFIASLITLLAKMPARKADNTTMPDDGAVL